jgi:serine/threonine protein kinase/CheY-like chemotaxis protein
MNASQKATGDILIVDDNPANLDLLLGVLRERDYRVRVTINGALAISAAHACPPDLIMLDINMPDMDGYEVCRQLKANAATQSIPIIFISALDEVMDKVKAFEVGGVDYVAKPFHFQEVLARIENQLKIFHLQREMERKNAELARKNEELLRSNKTANLIFSALSEVLSGAVLGKKYRLEKKIGIGGYGVVYRATHLALDNHVAIKIFQPKLGGVTAEAMERFRLEGISACRINHPNAISILDYGISDEGIPYLVMELLQGHTLGHELREKVRLPLARCAQILLPICDVLAAAHAAGIVHRDIKPDNIFLHQSPNGEVVKVVDFGIAKLLDETPRLDLQNLTVGGKILGTPTYMPPERLNNLPYDGRADVYSVGVMLYRMLCGRVPFQGKKGELWTIALMHMMDEPPPLRQFNPDIPEAVAAAVMHALVKDPHKRPTAKELAEEFLTAVTDKPNASINIDRSDRRATLETPTVTAMILNDEKSQQ